MSTSLKQDICGLGVLGVPVTDICSSRLEQYFTPEVQYACLYWVQHLQKCGAQLYDNDQVHQFLQTHLLHWLEALSWIRKISEGILLINSLESIALVSFLAEYHEIFKLTIVQTSSCPRLYAFIHDMKRFALYSRVSRRAHSSPDIFFSSCFCTRDEYSEKAV
jgi:hypothetical protein